MSISISELTIEELWGYQTFRIPIKDNKLVLVGENGIGKSTVANLIYFFRKHSGVGVDKKERSILLIRNEI